MKAVFFDRDGVINRDFGYVYRQEDFIFCDGIFELLEFCKAKGYLLLLVTNQSGIGMGYYTLDDFKILSKYMQNELKKRLGFGFDDIYFCPHRSDEDCLCRKPKPGMLQKAISDFKINLAQSILIGDKVSDVEAAQNAGIKYKILIKNQLENNPEVPMQDLYQVNSVKEILNLLQKEIIK
ncbi:MULTISPECIES: D-glycero-alpha-D-manno-heptose-1,7-bisphosphate 7-phosphatase [unclassified Helicobacter]|uniref:D-glycero-alpha-D-manno-heptose-1,7-bisphosphate 7-phosphatase n=1 Tax=unclassified Helicobacter TaxID=2593540 RepID=UPI000CF0357B|nr:MULTISPECIES: HAD family hydrolase [unclassified Helicobacter]